MVEQIGEATGSSEGAMSFLMMPRPVMANQDEADIYAL